MNLMGRYGCNVFRHGNGKSLPVRDPKTALTRRLIFRDGSGQPNKQHESKMYAASLLTNKDCMVIDSRTGWVPVCGVLFIALLSFIMVGMWQVSHKQRLGNFENARAFSLISMLAPAETAPPTIGHAGELQRDAARNDVESFSLLTSNEWQHDSSQSYSYSDDLDSDLVEDSELELSGLEQSRYITRNLAAVGPASPVKPKAPYHTSGTHKLVAPEEVSVFEDIDEVPFEMETEIAEANDAAVVDEFELDQIEFVSAAAGQQENQDSQLLVPEFETNAAQLEQGQIQQVALQSPDEPQLRPARTKSNSIRQQMPTLNSTRGSTKSAADKDEKPSWTFPIGIVKEMEWLHENAMTAGWVVTTEQILEAMNHLDGLDDPNISIVIEQLQNQLQKLEFLIVQVSNTPARAANQASGIVASHLRQIGYSIERRLEVWHVVHQLAKRQVPTEADEQVDGYNVGQFLMVSQNRLNTNAIKQGWAEYLQLASAAKVFNSMKASEFQQKKAARAVLARMYSPALTSSQKGYLQNSFDDGTVNVLRKTATDPVDLAKFLKRLEKLEANNNGATQFYLNDSYQNMLWADDPGFHALSDVMQTHYRNANFRVSISEQLLNRMVPRIPTTREPYRDQLMGAQIVGQNQISNQMRISLIPDPNQISMRLESYGKVSSRTTAMRDGITVENAGTSRFRIIKRLAFGQNGIFAYRPETTSQIAQKVVGLRSSVDNIPGIGRLVRNIARTKIEEQAPATERLVKTKLERQAEERFEKEIEMALHDLEASLTKNLLHPLIAMDLEPDPVQIKTTADRIDLRYRMAGRDQMAANTARPQGVPSSLMNLQIHESAVNNIASRFDMASKKFTTEELVDYLNGVVGTSMLELSPAAKKRSAEFVFAPFDPFRIQFVEDQIVVSINLKSFRIGEGKRWRNLTVKATYDPYITNGFHLGLNQAEEGVRVKGRRLNVGDQLAVSLICEMLFPEQFQIKMMPEKLGRQLRVQSLQATQFVVSNGWLGLSVGDNGNRMQQQPQYRQAKVSNQQRARAQQQQRMHQQRYQQQRAQQQRLQQQRVVDPRYSNNANSGNQRVQNSGRQPSNYQQRYGQPSRSNQNWQR